MINNEPLFRHPDIKECAKAAMLDAVDADCTVSDLQPLIYVKLKTQKGYPDDSRLEVAMSERAHNALANGGFYTLLDLVEATPDQIRERCSGVGVAIMENITWALAHYHWQRDCAKVFKKILMPNPKPPRKWRKGGLKI